MIMHDPAAGLAVANSIQALNFSLRLLFFRLAMLHHASFSTDSTRRFLSPSPVACK